LSFSISGNPIIIFDNDDNVSLNGHYYQLVDSSNLWCNGGAIAFNEFQDEFKLAKEVSPSYKITLPS
jgi:hypothetical protein